MKQKRQKGKKRRETKDERKEREAMLSGEEKINEKKWKPGAQKRKKIRKSIVTLRKNRKQEKEKMMRKKRQGIEKKGGKWSSKWKERMEKEQGKR